MLQRGLRSPVEDWVVIVDEAHNFPDAARELWTRELSVEACEAAMAEAERLGDPDCQGILASQFLRALRKAVQGLAGEYLVDEDGPVPEGELEARLLEQLRCASPRLAQAVKGFQAHGEAIRERKRAEGKLPRSWLGACADFAAHWSEAGDEGWTRLVLASPPRLACALLDAGVAAKPLLDARATLHLSATLAPLEGYRDALGLPASTPLHRFPPPHAPEQRLALYTSDVTTRHEDLVADPTMLPRIAARVRELLALGRPALLCFPSHDLLDRMRPLLPPGLAVERPGMGPAEFAALLEQFRSGRAGAIAGVMGGRAAEGVDFPGQLELVVVVGLPYPKPSFRLRALVAHFEGRHGRGWDYAVEGPAQRRVVQAAGRLLRGPRDRGVVVVLDRRAQRLVPVMPDLRASPAPAEEAARFLAAPSAGPVA
jgi:DNA excision repair protein ERCC-2